jgi:hypothetical protein
MLKINKKEAVKASTTNQELKNEGTLSTSVKREVGDDRVSNRAVRNGNYSATGYHLLDSPPTEAERWNKPFVDPEFGYESRSAEFH